MIEVQHLTKRYGSHTAVSDLNFAAENGRIYGFLGPNGAGKSTTMNMMTGYLAPTAGTILVDQLDLQQEPEKTRRRIGYLPEVPPVYTDMTVREYLRFAAELKGVPRGEREEDISRVMDAADLLGVQERLIRNLSKGYRQRAGLAQALVGNPEILILDEPTAGLDPEQQREMYDYLRSLKKDHTIIISSHILSDIRAVADYVWIINGGKMVASDTPEQLQSRMTTSQQILLQVAGDEKRLTVALQSIPGVERATLRKASDGTLCYTLESMQKEDIRPAVSRAAVYAGGAVLGITREETSLEDVFLTLTGEACAREATAAPTAAETQTETQTETETPAAAEADEKGHE